jgi:catalase
LLTEQQSDKSGKEYLFEEIKLRITKDPIKFQLFAQIAEDSDRIEDPSIAWPASRKKILLGIITLTKIAPNTPEDDKALFFIPNNIPDGIQTADPMLDLRSKAYPISVKERH